MNNILKFFNSRQGRAIHRWLGIIVAAYVIMASLSGTIHILMTNFYTPPPPVMPQGIMQLDQASLPLSAIVKHLPDPKATVKGVNLRTVGGKLWYQFLIEDVRQPVYINALTGEIGQGVDEAYARQIAADYLRTEAQNLRKTDYLIAFNEEYLNIYRAIPAYRFDEEPSNGTRANGVRVYVSTITGSVTLYLNNPRAFGQYAFSYLHKLAFIHNHALRDILQAALVVGIIITTLWGIGIFIARYIRK